MKRLILFAVILLLILPSISFAKVTCDNCQVGSQKCACSVSDCDSGFVEVHTASGCTGTPTAVYSFSGGFFKWSPKSERTYYLKAYCDDRIKTSACNSISVQPLTTTTTTTTKTITQTIEPPSNGGTDYTLIFLALLLVVLIVIFVYIFFIRKKKKPRVGYEELYRKWGR